MKFETAIILSEMNTRKMAILLADVLDPEFKKERDKILEKISFHKNAIHKLELVLEQKKSESALKWLPAVENKKREAEDAISKAINEEMKIRKIREP